jgi:hypothetical protein
MSLKRASARELGVKYDKVFGLDLPGALRPILTEYSEGGEDGRGSL